MTTSHPLSAAPTRRKAVGAALAALPAVKVKILSEQGDFQKAAAQYRAALEKAGKSDLGEKAAHKLGWAWFRLEKFDEGRRAFQRQRAEMRKHVAFAIRPNDYMRKVRVRRAANLVLFLASEESRFINGAELMIDNALSIQ